MTGNARRQTVRGVFTAGMLLLISYVPTARALQEKINPRSEYQYKKDYTQVEGIMKEADAQKRSDLLLGFVKEHPQSRMLPYVAGYYGQIVAPYAQAGNWKKVVEMYEKFLEPLPPGDKEVTNDSKTILTSLMGAYYQTGNFVKAAELGEKLYELDKDKKMAFALADIYLRMQNTDKYVVYAEKILAEFPMEQVYATALQMAQVHLQKQNVAKATECVSKVMQVYGDKVPPGAQESAWNNSRAFAFGLMGADAYGKKDYAKALEHYERVAKFAPKSDEAYYYIGMSKWRSQDPEGAINAFAKAAVLGKATAKRAQEYLEQLWRARHNDTLDGLDQILAKAKSELGIS